MLFHYVIFTFSIKSIMGARILGVFPLPAYSHQQAFQIIAKELSLRGHQVTVLTPAPINNAFLTNLTEIYIESINKIYDIQKVNKENYFIISWTVEFYKMMNKATEEMFIRTKDMTEEFDLILVEALGATAYGFGCKFKAPIITISTLGVPLPVHHSIGNPTHPVLNPDVYFTFNGEFNFYQKVRSLLYNLMFWMAHQWLITPHCDRTMKKHFGNDCPDLDELQRNVSLVFVNTNNVLHTPRPNVPSIIEMGRVHFTKKKPLPQDLQEYLDNSPQGVVYFSLGSNVKSVNLTENVRQVILEALSELPYNVLWKWESDHLPGKPDNVMTRQWLPQQDLLGHKNIKVFVTQGGLQSMEEAIANGVPLVGMPFFADQPLNVMKMVKLGIGVGLDYATMTKDELKNAILEVAQNNKYKEKINELRDLLQDQPMSGLDKAIWWIEYVIRHKGAKHLRSPAVDMPWWEYYLLDVIAFLLACFIVIMYINYLILRLIWRRIFRRNSQKTKVN